MESYLVKGDINGIQNFIYNVYEGEGGVAKILRARSFYISILSDVIIEYVKDIMDKEWECKTILNGGGGFIMEITPKQEGKEEEFKERLEDVRKNVEEFLLKKLYGEIGITFGYLKGKNEEINLNKLYERVDEEKKRKFRKALTDASAFSKDKEGVLFLEKPEKNGKNKRCAVCRTFFEKDRNVCEFCRTLKRLGTVLPKTTEKKIETSGKTDGEEENETFEIGKIGNTCFTLSLSKNKESDKTPLITVPLLKRNLTHEDINRYQLSEDIADLRKGMVAPFEVISLYSKGDNKLGYLVMDVDNLGLLFGKIRSVELQEKISKKIDEFFSEEVPKIARSNFKSESEKIDLLDDTVIYILYAGGDDLFAIGPWDKLLEFAVKVNKEFENFAKSLNGDREIAQLLKKENKKNEIIFYQKDENGKRKGLSLSAGFVTVKPKFTVRMAAEMCKKEEKKAKEKGKNAIGAFGEVLSWETADCLINKCKEKWVPYIEEERIPRGFFFRLYNLYVEMLAGEKKNMMFYPLMHYTIARNIKDEKVREEATEFVNNAEK
ncbi:type III-A CRISPR-associated protein Cas10/Csm1 [Desulfurobacterium sp.]